MSIVRLKTILKKQAGAKFLRFDAYGNLLVVPSSVPETFVKIAGGGVANGAFGDGAITTIGAKTDARSTATDTTAASLIALMKQNNYLLQSIIDNTGA